MAVNVYQCSRGCWADGKAPDCGHAGVHVAFVRRSPENFYRKDPTMNAYRRYSRGYQPIEGCPDGDKCEGQLDGSGPLINCLKVGCSRRGQSDPDRDHEAMASNPLVRSVSKYAAQVAANEVLRQTPGTRLHLDAKIKERERSKESQDQIALALKQERTAWAKALAAEHREVRWEKRDELGGYFQDSDCTWPSGCPVLTLGIN